MRHPMNHVDKGAKADASQTKSDAKAINLALQGGGSHGAFAWATSHAIMNRMQEIGFNAAFIREMRAVALINNRIAEGKMVEGKHMLIHVVEAEDVIRQFPGSSRLNNDWDFLCHLFEIGRERATQWLEAHHDQLGRESTVDLEAKYF